MTTFLFLLYLAEIARGVQVVTILMGVALLIGSMCAAIEAADSYDSVKENWEKRSKRFVLIGIILILCGAVIPSKQFFYMAVGLKAGSDAVQSEIGQKVMTLLEQELDSLLEQNELQQ